MFFLGLSLIVSKKTRERMENFGEQLHRNNSLLFFTPIICFIIGLPVIILHNIWTPDVVGFVTLLGWVTVLKGFLILLNPSWLPKKSNVKLRAWFGLILGLGLMYCGYYPYWK